MGSAEDKILAERIAAEVKEAGGRVFYVGGCVRDTIAGATVKDIDIEVHGIEYEKLMELLSGFGAVRVTGASFGVFGIKGSDLDIAMPRKEEATGRGHRDFAVYTDPFISPEKAALRRDFTINALMQDVLSGEVLDFFGGLEDLKHGIIRHVNSKSFAEDPLRVLRAAQFGARFNFSVAEDTLSLCSQMDITGLSRERVMGELEKALLKAERPSIFFELMYKMGQLEYWFPEVKALKGVPQDPKFHPEGDVWNHTMKTLDEAAKLRCSAKKPLYYMLSALCHDLGKAITTSEIDGRIHAYMHETEGESLVRSFLGRLTSENDLIKYALNMMLLHMRPNILVQAKSSHKAYMHLFDESVEPGDLLLIAKADYLGSSPGKDYTYTEKILREKLEDFYSLLEKPYVKGADLVSAGIEPGPEFKEALDYAHKLRLAGVEKSIAMAQTMGYIRTLEKDKNRRKP